MNSNLRRNFCDTLKTAEAGFLVYLTEVKKQLDRVLLIGQRFIRLIC